MEEGGVSPLVRRVQAGPIAAGLHAFRLTDQDKRLAIGTEYEWYVAVLLDPAQRSKDIISSGGVMRVALPSAVSEQLHDAKTGEAALVYAGAGLWYDAINAMVEEVASTEDKRGLAGQFSAILQQEEIAGVTLLPPVRE